MLPSFYNSIVYTTVASTNWPEHVYNGFQPIVDIASICKSVCRGMNYGHVSKSGFPCLEGRKMSEHTSLAHVPHRIFSLWHLTLTQDDT